MDTDDREGSMAPAGRSVVANGSSSKSPSFPEHGERSRNLSSDDVPPQDIDLATINSDEDDEARLPEPLEEDAALIGEGGLATRRAAIAHAVKLAPTSAGVYRMLNTAN